MICYYIPHLISCVETSAKQNAGKDVFKLAICRQMGYFSNRFMCFLAGVREGAASTGERCVQKGLDMGSSKSEITHLRPVVIETIEL